MAKRILAIDDDEDILLILDVILVGEGYKLIPMTEGATPQQVRLLHPDLILLDVRITGFPKTGDQICQEFKAHPELSTIPVVLLSAEEELRRLAYDCGADGFVNKPFNIDDITNKVKELIN